MSNLRTGTRTGTRSGTLRVPGATLYYEVRGTGPLLLVIPGGGGDATILGGLADGLAARYTVVTFDARGYSRSLLDGPPVDQRVDVQSDDAHRLIELLAPAGEPVYVFGISSGAIVGLDLLVRHPERVRLLIAHEPPAVEVLPDAAEQRAFFASVHATFRRQGTAAATAEFARGIGFSVPEEPEEPKETEVTGESAGPAAEDPETAAMMARLTVNLPLFLEHEVRQFTSHPLDVPAIKARRAQLVLAAGRESRGHLPYRPAELLAERLGQPLLECPGGHTGAVEYAAEFVELLHRTFEAGAAPGLSESR
ncbi:alpha/beta hydrolase [Streptomyces sp. NBC_01766]|nr:alpha/beta hydrolase [Streptomyces sp. NBC_01766]WSC21802.1 alpha/beta hydrolase [Streptomyces sp. NBC_01766]